METEIFYLVMSKRSLKFSTVREQSVSERTIQKVSLMIKSFGELRNDFKSLGSFSKSCFLNCILVDWNQESQTFHKVHLLEK